jgi:RNA polymerase sigma factor (sigma-70 family)
MRNDADARDLVQATCEIAIRKLEQLREPERLLPWLLTIQAREAFRVRRRLRRLLTTADVVELPSPGADVDAVVALREAVRRLPLRTRAAVIIHYMVGLSVSETASAMGISQNSVKSELKVGLERLREMLR